MIKQLAQRAVQRAKRSVGPTGACAGARAQRGRRLGGGRADGANYSNGALRGGSTAPGESTYFRASLQLAARPRPTPLLACRTRQISSYAPRRSCPPWPPARPPAVHSAGRTKTPVRPHLQALELFAVPRAPCGIFCAPAVLLDSVLGARQPAPTVLALIWVFGAGSDNYRFHSLAETYSSDNSDCTYSANKLCLKLELGVPCPKTGLWMWIDNGQGLTGDHGPITDMLAEKYLGDKSLTLTVPEGQQGVLQGRCTGEGLVGCTQLGARIDLVSSALHMSHIAIAGQSAIAQPTYTLSFPGHQSGGAICESAPGVGRTRPCDTDCCCLQTSMRARSGPSTACSITTTPMTRAARSWRTLRSRSRSRTAPSRTTTSTTSPEVTCARAAPSTLI